MKSIVRRIDDGLKRLLEQHLWGFQAVCFSCKLRIANADFPGEKNIFQFMFESLIS